MRIAVLASGRGSNLLALIEAIAEGRVRALIAGVFSDRPACGAMMIAREHAIPALALKPSRFPSRLAFDEALFSQVGHVQPDLIVCAGYMRLISEPVVLSVHARMINIHPSLLPRHPGLRTHARALEAGDAEHGASVHRVIAAVDAGSVIARVSVPVLADDNAESLAQRVLDREHPLLVACVKAIVEGDLELQPTANSWKGTPLREPLSLQADNTLERNP